MKRKKGFTLVELLVVVAIIALLVSILLPTLGRAKELARQAVCMANLSGIAKGWAIYGNEFDDMPPILPDIDQDRANYKDALELGEECTEADLGAGAQQNLCLLQERGTVSWKMFICPSSGDREADRSGGRDRKYGLGETVGSAKKSYCSYGFQVPYDCDGKNLCPITQNMAGGIPILGDQRPKEKYRENWSDNHPDDGESLLYFTGNVKFSKDQGTTGNVLSKNTGGWGGNNVYTDDMWADPKTQSPTLNNNSDHYGYPASTRDTVLYSWK